MKNNDSISQHGLFCFTKGPGAGEVCGGSADDADVGGDRVRDGHHGQGRAQLASGQAVPRVPSLPVTRCNTPHISSAADAVTEHYYNTASALRCNTPTLSSPPFHPPPPSSQYLTF